MRRLVFLLQYGIGEYGLLSGFALITGHAYPRHFVRTQPDQGRFSGMAFTTIVAILALGIAFVALWLVSDVLKKVEAQNDKFVRAHIAVLREEIRSTDKHVATVAKAVSGIVDSQGAVDKRLSDHTTELETVRSRIAKVSDDLDLLDRTIPQRGRLRVVAPKETDIKPDAKAKPTVQ